MPGKRLRGKQAPHAAFSALPGNVHVNVYPDPLRQLLDEQAPHLRRLIEEGATKRPLFDSVELFSGAAAISRNVVRLGGQACTFDIRDSPNEDLAKQEGFMLAAQRLLQLRRGGCLWCAPVCSTWVWVGRSQTGRTSENPAGFNTRCVQNANRMVENTIVLATWAIARGCFVSLEQPSSSILHLFPPAKALFETERFHRLPAALGHFGASSLKPITVWTNNVHFFNLPAHSRAAGRGHFESLVIRNEDGSVTGRTSELKQSQEYPDEFGRLVASAMLRSQKSTIFRETFL